MTRVLVGVIVEDGECSELLRIIREAVEKAGYAVKADVCSVEYSDNTLR